MLAVTVVLLGFTIPKYFRIVETEIPSTSAETLHFCVKCFQSNKQNLIHN